MRRRALPGQWSTLRAATLAVAAFAAANASAALAADPVPFSTLNANCDRASAQTFYGSPVTSSHAQVITRYTVASGAAQLGGSILSAGDVIWGSGHSLNTNDSPSVSTWCYGSPSNVPFTATFYDRPTTPTSFSGAGNTSGSALGFVAPGTAQYVADLTLSGGGVKLAVSSYYGDARPQNFASSGQYALGTLEAGNSLSVTALDGPRPSWTVTIRALPVAITDLTFDQTVTRPGAFIKANYSTSGDTSITAVVRNAAGQPVKTLASGLSVASGSHSLSWDARADVGQLLPDGPYTLQLDSRDPSGLTGAANTAITVDGTPPTVAITTPTTIAPAQAVSGQVTDALSGIASAKVQGASSYDSLQLPKGQTTFSVNPGYSGWSLGAHKLTITATDGAGNQRTLDYSFTVATPKPPTSSAAGSVLAKTPSRQSKRTATKSGIKVSGKGTGKIKITITVGPKTARRLHLKRATIARRTVTASGGRFTTYVKPTANARKALRRAHGTVTVKVRAAGAAKTVTLR